MTKEEFIKELENLGILVNEEILNKLDILTTELINYNKHTNLTRILEINDIYLKHYYDSLTITKIIDLTKISNLIDLGTGAGFPGLIIKIFYPNVDVTLLDSNIKKITWLKHITNILNIKVNIIHDRIENYSKNHLNYYDVVTSRAVANLRVLAELSLPLVKTDGYFIPLKANLDNEMNDITGTLNHFSAELIGKKSFTLINEGSIRNILKYKKNSNSNINDIRSYDKILKKPLKK